jgi:hypothetical protein
MMCRIDLLSIFSSLVPDHQELPPPEKTKIHSMMCDDVGMCMLGCEYCARNRNNMISFCSN